LASAPVQIPSNEIEPETFPMVVAVEVVVVDD
jgi:hypothetical protein